MHTFGTGKIDDRAIEKLVLANFDLRPKGIIHELDLLNQFIVKHLTMDILAVKLLALAGKKPIRQSF